MRHCSTYFIGLNVSLSNMKYLLSHKGEYSAIVYDLEEIPK